MWTAPSTARVPIVLPSNVSVKVCSWLGGHGVQGAQVHILKLYVVGVVADDADRADGRIVGHILDNGGYRLGGIIFRALLDTANQGAGIGGIGGVVEGCSAGNLRAV